MILNVRAHLSSSEKNSIYMHLVNSAMEFKKKEFTIRLDKLIEDNSKKQGRVSRHVHIRGQLFNHSKETTSQRMVNGRPIPKLTESVHFDLFDEGNAIYQQWQKLERDYKVMVQCLVLLTAGLHTWEKIRDCMPFQLDAYIGGDFNIPRKGDDIFWNLDITSPYLHAQVEEYSTMFAIYGLSEMLGI